MSGGAFDKDRFDARLAHLAEVSRNARATWFTLIFALLFAAIALADVRDVDFFRLGDGATLPLVGVAIPTYAFFIAAPLLLLALHVYFHLYLMKLWRALRAAADASDGRPLDEAAWPWLIADAAILAMPGAPRRALGLLTQAVSVALGWAFAPAALLLFWVRSWPPHDEWLSLFVLACALLSAAASALSLALGRAILRGRDVDGVGWARTAPSWALGLFLASAAALAVVSWERTEGGLLPCREVSVQAGWCGADRLGASVIPLYPADLRGAEFVARPADWRPRAEARRAFVAAWAGVTEREIAALLEQPEPPAWLETADAAFAAERGAQIARLSRPNLAAGRPLFGAFLPAPAADLRGADLRGAVLTGIDLTEARLSQARLDAADLEEAVLVRADFHDEACEGRRPARGFNEPACASLRRATLAHARMFRSDLSAADLIGADLTGADLADTSLAQARANNAVFDGATLDYADLSDARLSYASLRGASLDRADLPGADMGGADLTGARFVGAAMPRSRFGGKLDGADFSRADLTGAHVFGVGREPQFFWADMTDTLVSADLDDAGFAGALLRRTRFIDAAIRASDFAGAHLIGADLSRLDPDSDIDLSQAAADPDTTLPDGLSAPTCFAPPDHVDDYPPLARPQAFHYSATHLGMDRRAYIDAWVCGGFQSLVSEAPAEEAGDAP